MTKTIKRQITLIAALATAVQRAEPQAPVPHGIVALFDYLVDLFCECGRHINCDINREEWFQGTIEQAALYGPAKMHNAALPGLVADILLASMDADVAVDYFISRLIGLAHLERQLTIIDLPSALRVRGAINVDGYQTKVDVKLYGPEVAMEKADVYLQKFGHWWPAANGYSA